MQVGQQGGDDIRVAHMDVVDSSSSNHDGQTQLDQAANNRGLLAPRLEEMERYVYICLEYIMIR